METTLVGSFLPKMARFGMGVALLSINWDFLRRGAKGALPPEGQRYRLGLALREHSVVFLLLAISA